ncbi:hypothetical protein [Komagataeibacter kakiaceti]|uniref:hypothetical protein n=1 Tax=Komagataeibacter kakiaceti TaxID=943261 RepID=UPI00068909B6|nr:hypothetical protein [Komagataeibacter kakiaceti]
MGRRDGSASAVSCSDGRLSLAAGYFNMDTIRQALIECRREVVSHFSIHSQPILISAGAWLHMKLHELHDWNQGLLTLDGGTIVINHSHSNRVTILPVDVQGGGSMIFSAEGKRGGTLLLHLSRGEKSPHGLQLVFQGCEKQFACYDPMSNMTLVGLLPDGETPEAGPP